MSRENVLVIGRALKDLGAVGLEVLEQLRRYALFSAVGLFLALIVVALVSTLGMPGKVLAALLGLGLILPLWWYGTHTNILGTLVVLPAGFASIEPGDEGRLRALIEKFWGAWFGLLLDITVYGIVLPTAVAILFDLTLSQTLILLVGGCCVGLLSIAMGMEGTFALRLAFAAWIGIIVKTLAMAQPAEVTGWMEFLRSHPTGLGIVAGLGTLVGLQKWNILKVFTAPATGVAAVAKGTGKTLGGVGKLLKVVVVAGVVVFILLAILGPNVSSIVGRVSPRLGAEIKAARVAEEEEILITHQQEEAAAWTSLGAIKCTPGWNTGGNQDGWCVIANRPGTYRLTNPVANWKFKDEDGVIKSVDTNGLPCSEWRFKAPQYADDCFEAEPRQGNFGQLVLRDLRSGAMRPLASGMGSIIVSTTGGFAIGPKIWAGRQDFFTNYIQQDGSFLVDVERRN